MRTISFLFTLFLSVLIITSCQSDKKPAASDSLDEKIETPKKDVKPVLTSKGDAYAINGKSFMGIGVGDNLSDHSTKMDETILTTSEGNFSIYEIKDSDGTSLANVMMDPNNDNQIGNIIISSSKATTPAGVKVGMTLGELKSKIGDVIIHGSEIEGRTTIQKDGLSYRLDSGNWTYEIDQIKVSNEVKILEITILK